jgi:hypothetical protein
MVYVQFAWQVSKPPLKQIPKRPDSHNQRPKNNVVKRRRDDPEDDMDYRSVIRSMFG